MDGDMPIDIQINEHLLPKASNLVDEKPNENQNMNPLMTYMMMMGGINPNQNMKMAMYQNIYKNNIWDFMIQRYGEELKM